MLELARVVSAAWLVLVYAPFHASLFALQSQTDETFFESKIRPLLHRHCVDCHGPSEQSGGLRLDHRKFLLLGGESGAAIVPHEADASLLIRAIKRDGALAMPPETPLAPDDVVLLEHWIQSGAVWPESEVVAESQIEQATREHWAFQPLSRPVIEPNNETLEMLRQSSPASTPAGPVWSDWTNSPIDVAIMNRLVQAGLEPSPRTDRRTLLRRASFILTGLPPTMEQVEQFVNDPDPQAFEKRVDAYLASPHFGEHWARHWLDLARYSDTKGYVYGREERFWTHAWVYRDWVIAAFNRDLPYDQFIKLQLAADQISSDPNDLAAMGFLTLGRRFLGVKPDIIDDRIDVVTRGLLGLTVGCARCHDHKYDAVPTADYYSLYGVMASCQEIEKSITPTTELPPEYLAELQRRAQAYQEQHTKLCDEASERARQRLQDYLAAQRELDKYPGELFGQLFKTTDLLPWVVHRWADHLRRAEQTGDPFFAPWHQLLKIPVDRFASEAAAVSARLRQASPAEVHPEVATALDHPLHSPDDVVKLYADLLAKKRDQLREHFEHSRSGTESPKLSPDELYFFELLYGENAPSTVPNEPIVEIEYFLDFASCESLWKLQSEMERWTLQADILDRRVRVLQDRSSLVDPQIFRRGNPQRKGDYVPRQFLSLLSGPTRVPFQQGSGRQEMAAAIASPTNPLTARVMANRIWAHVFGQPLVDTPSDFGLRANPPSHPELLDYLASELIDNGWSIKSVLRQMVLSETFRQANAGTNSPSLLARAKSVDPDNRWLWHFRPQRLSIEQVRDTVLATNNALDTRVGGKAVEMWTAPFSRRRSIYGLVDRQFLPSLLRSFDFANPDLHIPERSETTVAQQSLFFLNHPFIIEQATAISLANDHPADGTLAVRNLFRKVLQREPSELEVMEAVEFLDAAMNGEQESSLGPFAQLAQVLYSSNEFQFIE
ncbi:MAG: PSD1 domain-containing protein [Planctomycetaceae bacterium]|nr:PSD1 domain-containing protein [Planctomycetaceae bacterium]